MTINFSAFNRGCTSYSGRIPKLEAYQFIVLSCIGVNYVYIICS